jgi:Tfp pilus assembly protein PilF
MALLKKNSKFRLPVILALLVVLLALGVAGGKWIVWPRVKAWREQRTNNVAREKAAQGDYVSAMTAIRTSLRYNQQNLDTWKLGAEVAEKQKSSDQLYFLQRIALLQPSLENKLKFIRLAVEKNALIQAQEIIAKVGPEGATSTDFLELAALVSRRLGNPTRAKYYLLSLIGLQPNNNSARFDLAELRMIEGPSDNRSTVRNEIRGLSSDPALRERALALLLADAIEQKDANETLELADQLSTILNLGPTQQVLVAEAYRRVAPTKFTPYVAQLEQSFAEQPDKVVVLTGYLTAQGQTDDVCSWIERLPEKTRAADNVQLSYAYALLLQKKWPELETYLRGTKWKESEFARHALLAYKYRVTGSDSLFNEEWKLAVIEVGNSQRKLQALLARTIAWNWQEERYELLWKRFSLDPADATTRQQLTAWETSKGNTAGLNRLFARVIELNPADTDAKNNYAYTCLLLDTHLDRAYEIAYANYRADPKNSFYATTQAFALYKQHKLQEALQLIEGVGIAALSLPERTLLRALFLAESAKPQEAADLVSNIRPNRFSFPEERRLFDNTIALIAKAQREQNSVARIAASSGFNTGAEHKSWIAMLPEQLRKSASVPMELADTFYAADDFPGLENALKADRWEQNDFLRLALLAYAQRNLSKDGDARGSWRAALAGAGNDDTNLSTLTEMSLRWGWTQERIELFSRIYQRDPLNEKVFAELSDHFTKTGETAELARIYEARSNASPGDFEAKSRLAYFSLLTGSNLSRAHVLAREAFDAAPEDSFRAKVYALSLLKQTRPGDAWRVLEPLPDKRESGQAQTCLIKAAVAMQRKNDQQVRDCLNRFDAASALPEEASLAESLLRTLNQKDN